MAGEFRLSCFSDVSDCADKVSHIVTDKFTKKFPANRFQIAVIAEFQKYSDGGGVGYAIAGVTTIPKDKSTIIPKNRYASTTRIVNSNISAYDVTKETEELLRRAVENLMADCDRSPSCDVYIP